MAKKPSPKDVKARAKQSKAKADPAKPAPDTVTQEQLGQVVGGLGDGSVRYRRIHPLNPQPLPP